METLEQASPPSESPWKNTSYANLIRYEPSGTYFARVRVGGKLIRQSLKTKVLSVAKLKLGDLEKSEREKLESTERSGDGKALFADLLAEYREQLQRDVTIKPGTRTYREECIKRILKSWPQLPELQVRKIAHADCVIWASRLASTASPTSYNNTTATLRHILEIAVDQGLRYTNPAAKITRKRPKAKDVKLPSREQFRTLVAEIRKVPFGPVPACADLVEFLAYGGFRKGEAANITWDDCDFARGDIVVRGDAVTTTKNGEMRRVPMIPDMLQLLRRLRDTRLDKKQSDPVMRVRECQGALNRGCKALRISRFTHHDLRHLFATRCIESGIDIPTVSKWLGHRDGGALAMKTYGHLRDEHSQAMAEKVAF